MAVERLQVLLQLEAGQYKREAREAATATGRIGDQASKTGTATSRAKGSLMAFGGAAKVAAAGAALALGNFVKDSIQAASNLEESINAVQKTFGPAADGILQIGERSAESFGMSNRAFNEFAVRFSAFADKIAKESGRSVIEVVEEMAGRVADFASVHNLSMEEAMQVSTSTLAGETEAFRRFGGDVSAAAVQQKALEMGLADTSSGLTEQHKILARYELLMDQTNETAGDFKDTQDGLANSTKTLSADWEDFTARIGDEFVPVAADAAKAGISLLDIFDEDVNIGWTQRLSAGIQLVTGEGGQAVASYIEQKEALNDIDDATGTYLTTVEESIGASNRHRGAIDETGDAAEGAADDIKAYETSVEALEAAEERQRAATERARDAVLAKRDALRNIHNPMFHLIELNGSLVEAEANVEEASKKGVGSPEYQQAVIDRAKLIADLETTMIDLKSQGIDPTGAAARLMFEDLDVPPEVIDQIFASFDEVEQDFENRTFRAQVSFPTWRVGNEVIVQTGTQVFRQHGGPVDGPFIAGEAGRELVVPRSPGMVLPNQATEKILAALAGKGGGQVFNIAARAAIDERSLAREISWGMRTAGV